MADISKMNVGGTEYNIKDETARNALTDKADPTKKISIALSASAWAGGDEGFAQTVSVSGGTANSLVNLQATLSQIAALQEAGVTALLIKNDSGTFYAEALGAAPAEDMTIQATLTEVAE